MNTIIFDVDDVIRNLRTQIEESMNIYFHSSNWGEYHYNNANIREFMDWYSKQPFYGNLYKYASINEPMKSFIKYKIATNDKNKIWFLSANKHKTAISITKDFLKRNFGDMINHKQILFVDSWKDKLNIANEKIYNKYDKKILFVDDRLDTIKIFAEDGRYLTFWYIEYLTESSFKYWIKETGFKPKYYGNHLDFEKFYNKNF